MTSKDTKLNMFLFHEFAIVWILTLILSTYSLTITFGATTATIAATVTVKNISVVVSDGSISYGNQALGEIIDTTINGLNDSQTATNNGTVTADLNIRGQNSANWTLGATQGADQYFHKFCTTVCDGSPTWNALTTNYQTLVNGIAASGTQVFDLQLGLPTSSSNFTQQDVDVTVQAVDPV